MFMLNLLFDFSKQHGKFTDNQQAASPLQSSVHWLVLNNNVIPEPTFPQNPPTFNVENAAAWQDTGERGTLVIPKLTLNNNNDPANIAIRVAPDPSTPGGSMPSKSATVQMVVSFGRPLIAAHTNQASPFQDTNLSTLTTFPFDATRRNTMSGVIPFAWFFHVGVVKVRPDPNPAGLPPGTGIFLNDRYQFSLGIVVKDGATVRHFGEDPEMDIGQ